MDKNNWYVYIHKNLINNKIYIGITCKKPKDRWRGGANYKHNIYFNNAILKYGWDNFEHIIFAEKLNKDKAQLMERMLIRLWKSNQRKHGYNLSSGGESSRVGCRHSEETRQKLREMNLGDNNPRRRLPKQKTANASKLKPVYCFDYDMSFVSVQAAADYFNIEASNISKCCKGMRQTAGRMSWEYVNK